MAKQYYKGAQQEGKNEKEEAWIHKPLTKTLGKGTQSFTHQFDVEHVKREHNKKKEKMGRKRKEFTSDYPRTHGKRTWSFTHQIWCKICDMEREHNKKVKNGKDSQLIIQERSEKEHEALLT